MSHKDNRTFYLYAVFTNKPSLKIIYWLSAWVVINLLQAGLSPIDADEAYYWMYAAQLDWGYFDHPPAVAALIALGKDWLPGSLGLRFGHVIAGAITAWAIWDMLDRPRGQLGWLAALLITVQPMLQVYGFIATPDGPLLLFTALLLREYKNFLATPKLSGGVAMAFLMAALLYSKYHGILLIVFMILPNLPWLIRQPGAWLAAGLGALLYVPHLYWQYANDFPSFRYHLSGRNDPYQLKYTLEFIGNQLLIFNPLLLFYYWKSLRKKSPDKAASPADRFYRACRWLVLLTLGFFLYSTLKGGTEAQWTAMLCVPLIYLLFRNVEQHPEWIKTLRSLAYISLLLFAIGRLFLALPQAWIPIKKPFNAAPWVAEIADLADGKPVVFENSYRDPSHYMFYADGRATTFTNAYYRPNQYDLWRNDTLLQGQDVLLVGKDGWEYPGALPFRTQGKRLQLVTVSDFEVAKFVKLSNATEIPARLKAGQPLPIRLYAHNTENFSVDLTGSLTIHPNVVFQDINGSWRWVKLLNLQTTMIRPGEPQLVYEGVIQVPADLVKTDQLIHFGLSYEGMAPLRGQSAIIPVVIE